MSINIHQNNLKEASSPYLLQHANNPVHWQSWEDTVLETAKAENKLLIISVGYAACHWCHVMEHEAFEDEEVAAVMNQHYVNIKVDREERPDIDQVYMSALQLMTRQGGWPMNIIALPDGRPVWGGTYVRKKDWIGVLHQVADLYQNDPKAMLAYAEKLTKGVKQLQSVVVSPEKHTPHIDLIHHALAKWSESFDHQNGGMNYAPKFMMPTNYAFLMRYAHQFKDKALQEYVKLSLDRMSYGGLYDAIGGGFARYSVDEKWHVPHFEKMLYDNAQLIGLYVEAYTAYANPWYKTLVYQTIDFMTQNWQTPEGAFYASLDADSLNAKGVSEEGAFYTWTKHELQELLQQDFDVFADYYNVNATGYWENGQYVLFRTQHDAYFLEKYELSLADFENKKAAWRKVLAQSRQKRPQPGLDDKVLTAWNALALTGLVSAYNAFGETAFLDLALQNAHFISEKLLAEDGQLWRTYKNGKARINAYLDDYATTIEAFAALYQATFDEKWLSKAQKMTHYVLMHFSDEASGLFFYTSDEDVPLITRSIEYSDNVIPASCALMAKNLHSLYYILDEGSYKNRVVAMLEAIIPSFIDNPSGYTHWMQVFLDLYTDFYEVSITGRQAHEKRKQLSTLYFPNKIVLGAESQTNLPKLASKFNKENTYLYICKEKVCSAPFTAVGEVLAFLENQN